ncbi:MAG: Rieske (2Fe-2S) protein [Acidimicrobiales bacterium]
MAIAVTDVETLPIGTPRTVRAGDRRITLVRTDDQVFALEHACPHQGYALAQGEVRDDVLTCAWHNWKFQLTDGRCLKGDEDVRTYPARVDPGGQVWVELTDVDPAVERPRLMRSLAEAVADLRVGQIARDTVRLLRASADPGELVWEAVAFGAPRAEFGWGHSIASAVDCLAIADRLTGDDRALPVVQALAGIAETEIRRPPRARPSRLRSLPADPATAFRSAVEAESHDDAEALVLAAIEAGFGRDEMRRWFVSAVSDHHLAYGHAAIYMQKAFELLDRLGWDRAATVLPHLVPTIAWATREDKLPYMRPFVRALGRVDLEALASRPVERGWADDGRLRAALVNGDRVAPLAAMEQAVRDGAGAEGVLSVVSKVVGERLLGYDLAVELDPHVDFGWLDITHGLTYANAVRWAWREQSGPDTMRMVSWAVFLAWYTGRVGTRAVDPEPSGGDFLTDALAIGDGDAAGAAAMAADAPAVADCLERAALEDRAGSFIVAAHHVKTARAAAREAAVTGSQVPLAGTARFIASPIVDRFVRTNVARAIDLVSGRVPSELQPADRRPIDEPTYPEAG